MLIDDLFKQVLTLLVEDGYDKMEDYLVDGTKVEANANRHTFVWKKSAENFQNKLRANVDQLISQIDEIIEEEQASDEPETEKPVITTEKIQMKVQEWETRLREEPSNKVLKKAVKKMKEDYLPRSRKYDEQLNICGERNSYSKTDQDAYDSYLVIPTNMVFNKRVLIRSKGCALFN
jgi:hypothetical protein